MKQSVMTQKQKNWRMVMGWANADVESAFPDSIHPVQDLQAHVDMYRFASV